MRFIERLATSLMLRLMRRRLVRKGFDVQKADKFLKLAVQDLEQSAEDALAWNKSEVETLSARLERRYDVGLAMNESANRAIAAKKAAGTERDIVQLTASQKLALKLQEETIQRAIRDHG